MSFRRDFDREAVDIANGRRPARRIERYGATKPSPPAPERWLLVIAKAPHILGRLLQFHCNIKPTGSDWHILVANRNQRDRLVGVLTAAGIHGIMRRAPTQ